jgi:hypothetical protein
MTSQKSTTQASAPENGKEWLRLLKAADTAAVICERSQRVPPLTGPYNADKPTWIGPARWLKACEVLTKNWKRNSCKLRRPQSGRSSRRYSPAYSWPCRGLGARR